MNGAAELVIIVFYLLVAFFALRFLWISYEYRSSKKKYPYLAFAMAFLAFVIWYPYQSRIRKVKADMENVGAYTLTKYPNCKSCVAVLKSNMTYTVLDKKNVIEVGDWHYEVGQDYWIVYLNGKHDQLGSGKYVFSKFIKGIKISQ